MVRSADAAVFALLVARPIAALNVCVVRDAGFEEILDPSADPASITSDSQLTGFNQAMRQEVLGNRLGLDYRVTIAGWNEAVVKTRTGECDIGWAAFYVSSVRELCIANANTCQSEDNIDYAGDLTKYTCCVDYSTNYYPWTISIMAPSVGQKSFFEALFSSIGSTFVLNFICFAFIYMVIGGHLMWIVERTENPDVFPSAYFEGIDDAIWWAMVTATTVGYGDKVPITPAGRIIAMFFMTIGIALFGVLAGHLSAAFVEARLEVTAIRTMASLEGTRVGGFPSVLAGMAEQHKDIVFTAVPCQWMSDCGALLEEGRVDAIVYDKPVMAYWRKTNAWAYGANLVIGDAVSSPPVGIVFPEHGLANDMHSTINAALINFITADNAAFQSLINTWFPSGDVWSSGSSDGEQVEWSLVIPTIILVLLYAGIQLAITLRKKARGAMPVNVASGSTASSKKAEGAVPIKVAPGSTASSEGAYVSAVPKSEMGEPAEKQENKSRTAMESATGMAAGMATGILFGERDDSLDGASAVVRLEAKLDRLLKMRGVQDVDH